MKLFRTVLAVAAVAFATPSSAQADAVAADPAVEASPAATAEPTVAKPTGPDYYLVDTDLSVDPETVLYLDLSGGGRVAIRLKPEWAPNHVARIQTLVRQGFYDGISFHRVIDGFMAQTGDPTGTGGGGSTLPDLEAEFNKVPHLRGSVSMARTDEPDTANSQFFIVFYPRMSLDRSYTNFGRVIAGMEYVDAIKRGQPPANPTRILQASLASDGKGPPRIGPAEQQDDFTAEMLNAPIADDPAGADGMEEDEARLDTMEEQTSGQ